MARRLADVDVARDHGLEDGLVEVAADLVGHLVGQVELGVVHRQDDPADLEPVVVPGLGLPGQVDDLREPFHREVFALDRDVDLGRRPERRPGELAERGGAVEEDEVEVRQLAVELLAERRGPLAVRGREGVGVGQALRAGQDEELGLRRSRRPSRRAAGRRPAGAAAAGSTPSPLVALHWGSMSMTSAVRPALARPGGEVDRGGRLAHPALLVGHADDLGHVRKPPCSLVADASRRADRLGRPCPATSCPRRSPGGGIVSLAPAGVKLKFERPTAGRGPSCAVTGSTPSRSASASSASL